MSETGEFLFWMDSPEASIRDVVGSKASSLARVAGARFFEPPSQESESRLEIRTIENAALTEIPTPEGFVVCIAACSEFLGQDSVAVPLNKLFAELEAGDIKPEDVAISAQVLIDQAELPENLLRQLNLAVTKLLSRCGQDTLLAVRSSATAEDLVGASFAGQYESVLAVHGLDEVLRAYRIVVGSLFSARVLAYSRTQLISARSNLMAVVVQRMVRSDLGASGVLLSSDPDLQRSSSTGLDGSEDSRLDRREVASLEACWGMGDALVGGLIIPERYEVENQRFIEGQQTQVSVFEQRQTLKSNGTAELVPTSEFERTTQVLDMDQILLLNSWGLHLSRSFGHAVELEWAIDGLTDEMFLVQVRPFSATAPAVAETPVVDASSPSGLLGRGVGIGSGAIESRVCVLSDPRDTGGFRDGDVLVTSNTDPSWLPLMLAASALITEQGGRNSHAAILSRELGLLCVVGFRDATTILDGVNRIRLVCNRGVGTVSRAGEDSA